MASLTFEGIAPGQTDTRSYESPVFRTGSTVSAALQSGDAGPFHVGDITVWSYVWVDTTGELPGPHPPRIREWEPQEHSTGGSPIEVKAGQKVTVEVRFTAPPVPDRNGYRDTLIVHGLEGGDLQLPVSAGVSLTFAIHTTGGDQIAILGESDRSEGVRGTSHAQGHAGVVALNDNPSTDGSAGQGLFADSRGSDGVLGISHAAGKAGVAGVNDDQDGNGLYGRSRLGNGVFGISSAAAHAGVAAVNDGGGVAVFASANNNEAIHADTISDRTASVAAFNRGKGPALYGKGASAAVLEGDVLVHGNLTTTGNITATGDIFLPSAHDCAEAFEVDAPVEAGTVLVIGDDERLHPCDRSYDPRVAGVVSGAGAYRPGLILGRRPGEDGDPHAPVALIGRAFCKVDADLGAIEVGDLLTTSPTPGHAMRATDPSRAAGAVLGKAMRAQGAGRGIIPVLIGLH